MAEVQNKITYADFYPATTNEHMIDNLIDMWHQMYEYMAQLTGINVLWWKNDTLEAGQGSAVIYIYREGYNSRYELQVTNVGVTSGSSKVTSTLICESGKTVSLWSSTYKDTAWVNYGERFIYLSMANVFVLNAHEIKNSSPSTTFNTSNWAMFAKLEDQTSLYHSTAYSFYLDSGVPKNFSKTIHHTGDVNKIILANLYVGASKIKDVCILRTADTCRVTCSAYYQLEGYGKYYGLYPDADTQYAIGVKLGD